MFKGLTWLVLRTELKLTNAQQSATKRSGSVHKTNCKGRSHITTSVALETSVVTGCAIPQLNV